MCGCFPQSPKRAAHHFFEMHNHQAFCMHACKLFTSDSHLIFQYQHAAPGLLHDLSSMAASYIFPCTFRCGRTELAVAISQKIFLYMQHVELQPKSMGGALRLASRTCTWIDFHKPKQNFHSPASTYFHLIHRAMTRTYHMVQFWTYEESYLCHTQKISPAQSISFLRAGACIHELQQKRVFEVSRAALVHVWAARDTSKTRMHGCTCT